MSPCSFVVEPFSLPLAEASVSANISRDQAGNFWAVTIVLSRAPDQAALQGDEIDSQLIDEQGAAFAVLERPAGSLVQAGSSLSSSSNALFRFHDAQRVPVQLVVVHQGQAVHFRILPATVK